jgi:hypothetical protein
MPSFGTLMRRGLAPPLSAAATDSCRPQPAFLAALARSVAAGATIAGRNFLLTIFAYCFRQRRSRSAAQLWMKLLSDDRSSDR